MPPLPKRKALGGLENVHAKPSKQPRLDAFFLPRVPPQARPVAGRDETTTTGKEESSTTSKPTLSDEQQAVLGTVVDEGRSIFFTGSAGSLAIPLF